MKPLDEKRLILLGVCVAVALVVVADYLAPAELQIDLNAPRFRLVRHRKFFPDEELQMEWKHSSRWAFPRSEVPAVFGQRETGGFYAWELETGSRFESIYGTDENGYPMPYESLRTNVFSFQISTRPLHKARWPLESSEKWAKSYHESR